MATVTKTIGPISAYAIAVANGYTGTEQAFADEIANASTNAQTAAAAAATCEEVLETLPPAATGLWAAVAPPYNSGSTYIANQYVTYNSALYKCISSDPVTGTWDAAKWEQQTVAGALKSGPSSPAPNINAELRWLVRDETLAREVSEAGIMALFAKTFSQWENYKAGDYVLYDGKIRRALCDITSGSEFAPKRWLTIDLATLFGGIWNDKIVYHDTASSSYTMGDVTMSGDGLRYTISGTTEANGSALKVVLVRAVQIGTSSYPANPARPVEMKLKNGHTYEARMKYISGTPSVAAQKVGSDVQVGALLTFLKQGNNTRIASASYPNEDGAWYVNQYARITYNDATMSPPDNNGITPAVFFYRKGFTEEELDFGDYTFEVTLHDITDQLAIAPVEHETAIANHVSGDVFWLNDLLYKATAAITKGETLTVGTNCAATSITQEISAVSN